MARGGIAVIKPSVRLERSRAKKACNLQYRIKKSIKPTTNRIARRNKVLVLLCTVTEVHPCERTQISDANLCSNFHKPVEHPQYHCRRIASFPCQRFRSRLTIEWLLCWNKQTLCPLEFVFHSKVPPDRPLIDLCCDDDITCCAA